MPRKRIPEICDYDCPFAAFPPAETAGICRTMSAVWCKKLTALVSKNTPCEWRRRAGHEDDKPGVPTRKRRSAARRRRP
ncbi:MAG: hypothetical protein U1D55_10430 [Phycisphaerae bacterium]